MAADGTSRMRARPRSGGANARPRRWLDASSFAPLWLPPSLRHPAVGYLMAVLSQGAATGLILLLDQVFPRFAFPSALGLLVIVLVALSWGAGPGIVSTVVSAMLINVLVLPPRATLSLATAGEIVSTLFFLVAGVLISVVASQTERARRRAQELAGQREAIFEAMADGLFVFGPGGRIEQMNETARRLFGLDAPSSTYDAPLVDRGYRAAVRAADGTQISQDQLPLFRVLNGETLQGANAVDLIIEAPGRTAWELNMTGAPVRDVAGRVHSAVCVVRDVTEQRLSEHRTQEALDALLAMAEALVLASGDAGDAEEMPDVRRVGRRLAELTRSVLACQNVALIALEPVSETLVPVAIAGFAPRDEPRWWSQWEPGLRLADRLGEEHIVRLRADEVLVLDRTRPPFSSETALGRRFVLMAPLRVGNTLTGVLSLAYGDAEHTFTAAEMALAKAAGRLAALVIERERLQFEREEARGNELALRESNRRMDEFLGVASHELRTPLTSILGSVQLAERRLRRAMEAEQPPEDWRTQLEVIRDLQVRAVRQTKRIDRLVSDLLDVSRIRANRLELAPEPCDLAAIVREAVEEQRRLNPERGIELQSPGDMTVPVVADADRIGQVVTNYLTNALKYSPEAQPVEVDLRVEEGEACLSVRDHGPGLSAAEQAHIWERFYRVPGVEPQSGSGVGLGLGLHISRTIVELHHGRVGVESVPGDGATFWFALPLAPNVS